MTRLQLRFRCGYYTATVYQLLVSVVALWLTRFPYYIYNADEIGVISVDEWMPILWGGLRFDLCAVAYFNLLFIAMRFLPFGFVERRRWTVATNIVFGVSNAVMLALNISDVAYSSFNGGRMRWSTLAGAFGDSNMVGIIISYFHDYWWVYLLAVVFIGVTLAVAYIPVISGGIIKTGRRWLTIALRVLIFVVASFVAFVCIRGDLSRLSRPLGIADAMRYVANAKVNLILNTPFSVLRSIGKVGEVERVVHYSDEELSAMRRSVHHFCAEDTIPGVAKQCGKNVMIIELESGAQLWIDTLNIVNDDTKRGLTPFLDSIASHSMVCRNVMATGVTSVGGTVAIFGGFPTFEPFRYVVSSYNGNVLDTPVNMLKMKGYSAKAYFGGKPGSFNIDQSLNAVGFNDVVTCVDYGVDNDYDGTWGIFDHAMGAYAARDMSTLPQPFIAGWFTISAHGPFTVPSYWKADGYKSEPRTPQQSVEYTDRALRHFFNIAKEQPWYDNTVFIITGDHGCRELKHTKYDTPYIKYHIPFIVYTPDGSVKPGEVEGRVMSQFDIAPTLLHIMGYDEPFVSLGTDLFDVSQRHYALSSVNGRLMITGEKYVVMTDMKAVSPDEVYDIVVDQSLSTPLDSYDGEEVDGMVRWARAFMQDYTCRMIDNRMSFASDRRTQ